MELLMPSHVRAVQGLTRGGAAERSGRIQPGDVLLAVDRETTRGVPPDQLVRRLCGPEGTEVELRLARGPLSHPGGGGGGEWTVVLLREAMRYTAEPGWPGTLEAV